MTDVIVSAPPPQIVVTQGPSPTVIQSSGSLTINNPFPVGVFEMAFAFGDVAVLPLMVITAGLMIYEAQIVIKTAFNGTVTLSIGDSGNNQSLHPVAANNPLAVNAFTWTPDISFGSNTQLNLYKSVSGTSQGTGIIRINYQRA